MILVTGVSGFSGGYIYQHLKKHGYPTFNHWGRAAGDLSEMRTVSAWTTEFTKHPDIIVHVAAQSPAPGVTNTDIYKNIPATYNLIRYAKAVGVKKIIYFSSDSIYGEVHDATLYLSSPITNPGFYGQTKLVCEGLLHDSDIQTVSLRLPLIVGKGAKRNWLARIMQAIKEKTQITVYNPNDLFNNVVHIQFISGLIESLIKEEWPPFNLHKTIIPASIKPLTIKQVVSKIVKEKIPIMEGPATHSYCLSTRTIQKYNPWTVERTIDQYVLDEFTQS